LLWLSMPVLAGGGKTVGSTTTTLCRAG